MAAAKSSLEEVFNSFANQARSAKGEALEIDNTKFSKLCRDCKLLNKGCTATDVDIVFAKYCEKTKRYVGFSVFCKMIDELALKHFKGLSDDEAREKFRELIASGGGPRKDGTTRTAKDDVTSRLTDTSKYTGSHKERFDESGKGKGLEGRADVERADGYVGGYKQKGTYDDTH